MFENDPHNVSLILDMDPAQRPLHCFADVKERCPKNVLEQCQFLLQHALLEANRLKSLVKDGQLNKIEMKHRCMECGSVLAQELMLILSHTFFLEEGYCKIHGRNCPFSPRRGCMCQVHTWVEIAGNTCKPWSRLNQKSQVQEPLLEKSTLDMFTQCGIMNRTSLFKKM